MKIISTTIIKTILYFIGLNIIEIVSNILFSKIIFQVSSKKLLIFSIIASSISIYDNFRKKNIKKV